MGEPSPDDGVSGESASDGGTSVDRRRYGDTWVYESIVGALPGVDLSRPVAVAVQFGLFEGGVLLLAAVYGLWAAVLPGTVAVAVAAAGSAVMLDLGDRIRRLPVPSSYRRLLFGTGIEVVLGLVAYVGLVTYLFVYDPRDGASLVVDLLGPRPPLPAAYLFLLVLWDLCYRIGTGWWASLVAAWRSTRYRFDAETVRALRVVDRRTVGFALLQLALLPFLDGQPVLAAAVVGHVVAVLAAIGIAERRRRTGVSPS